MKVTRTIVSILFGVAAGAGCHHGSDRPPAMSGAAVASTSEPTSGGAPGMSGQAARCPLAGQPGAVAVVDQPDGAAVVVDAPADRAALVEQLRTVAETHNRERAGAAGDNSRNETGSGISVGNSVSRGSDLEAGTEGRTGFEAPGEDEVEAEGWVTAASEARVEERGGQVALVFTADGDDVSEVQSELHDRAADLQACGSASRNGAPSSMGSSSNGASPMGSSTGR